MIRLVARRLVYVLLTMLLVSVALFLLFEISPGTVAADVLGPYSTPEQRLLWLERNGYFEPAYRRYLAWLMRFAAGDFGQSRIFDRPVAAVLWPRLGSSAMLALCFFAVTVPLSIGSGVLAGMREGSRLDRLVSFVCILTTSVPPFASAVLLSALFVFELGWLPGTSGMMGGFALRELVLPVTVLVLYDFGYVARITRAAMVEVMTTAYVRTAILKGMPYWWVILRHALRNALIAPFTVIMLQVNWLIGGVIVVEFFFAYKGFGSLILEASLGQDLYLLEASTMLAVLLAVGTQTVADIGYGFLNPRIRFRP
ncbi:MAG: ABC transporter permease [Proteobacteria bacterium]|nr:ABC transporter permease [Pseudomonadota bacterium]MBI3505761.1 ABC transporter permease [Pseudomonadota bacterium]